MFNNINTSNVKTMTVNFGPQHPAAHGVLRLNLELHNERILKCDPHIGLLHRNTENLILTKPNFLSLPYFDRLDYVSMLTQEHAYTLAVENINNKFNQPVNIQICRTLMDEISRILNHFLAVACHCLDVGTMSVIFWAFEERENFMSVYESITGARMHTAYTRPLYFNRLINQSNINELVTLLSVTPITLTEITSILNINKVWKLRLKNIGVLFINDQKNFNISGVLLRSVNRKSDLRKNYNTIYSYYKFLKFTSYTALNGDSLDRFNLRIYEILESLNIINVLSKLNIKKHENQNIYFMEQVIEHFKVWSGVYWVNQGEKTSYIESSKGVFGVHINFKNNNSVPLTCKIRSPSYNHLLILKNLIKGLQLADLITLIGTIDIVFGEIDR